MREGDTGGVEFGLGWVRSLLWVGLGFGMGLVGVSNKRETMCRTSYVTWL